MNIAYLNGAKCGELTQISLYNPTFLYGVSCFEGVRAYWSAERSELTFLDLGSHLDRLYESAEAMGLPPPVSRTELEAEVHAIISADNVREDVYFRITFYIGGDGSWRTSRDVHYLVSVRSMPSRLADPARSVRLGVSRFRRIPTDVMPPQVKAGANYLNSRYAYRDAVGRGFDDALFLTTDGFVSEATGAAVFFVAGEDLVTPSVDCDLLRSITRQRVIGHCRSSDVTVREARIPANDIAGFDAAFVTGTSVELCPVSAIDETEFPVDHSVYLAVRDEFVRRIVDGAL